MHDCTRFHKIISMLHLICKRLQPTRSLAKTRAHSLSFSTSSIKPSLHFSNSTDPQSLTVSYLVNSCGLSLESAISASKKLQIGKTDQPDSVLNILKSIGLGESQLRSLLVKRPLILVADANKTLKPNVEVFCSLGFFGTKLLKMLTKHPRFLEVNAHSTVEFFRAHGFSTEQISILTRKYPELYLYNAPKNFKPKLEYFKSLGFSDAEIARILLCIPATFGKSLKNCIIPSIQVIRRIVGTNENVIKVIKANSVMLGKDLEKLLEPNIAILINHGVPKSMFLKVFILHPRFLLFTTRRFTEAVEEVEKLGFDPTNMSYLLAVRSLGTISKSLWERKLGVFRSFGMSEGQILSAFRRQPMCIMSSEEKIKKLMGFFVNELKISALVISKNPGLLLFSLEKRIFPRCSVLQLLMSKGVLKGDFRLVSALQMSHKKFDEKYLTNYQNVIPEVVEAHQEITNKSNGAYLFSKKPIGLIRLKMGPKKFEYKYVSKYQIVIPAVVEAHQGKIKFQGFSVELKA